MSNLHKILILFLGLISFQITAQSYKKRVALSHDFLKKVRVREVLDTMLWDKESIIFNQTEKWFKEKKLNVYNGHDYEFFQSSVMHQFLFSKRHILNRVAYHYKHIDYKLLQKYVHQIDQGHLQEVIFSSGLYEMLNEMLQKEIAQVKNVTVPKYLQYIVNKHKPVDLNVKFNGKPVRAKDLDLDIYVETNNADYKKVHILDKVHNRILKPEGYTYEQIQKIVIRYKDQSFEFKPDSQINLYPHQFKELNSMISKYSYNQIPVWHLDIIESKGHVGVQLTNVIEAKIIKQKPQETSEKVKSLDK